MRAYTTANWIRVHVYTLASEAQQFFANLYSLLISLVVSVFMFVYISQLCLILAFCCCMSSHLRPTQIIIQNKRVTAARTFRGEHLDVLIRWVVFQWVASGECRQTWR